MRIEVTRRVSFSRQLGTDEVLRLVFGLREIEVRTYQVVSVSRAGLDVEAVARKIDRDRTTAQRSLGNLVSAGLVVRRVIPHERLCYEYEVVSEEEIKKAVRQYIKELYEQLTRSVDSL
jgi:predicted transcriptional regulator